MFTEGECLGNSCRFYNEQPGAICFKQGVLPRCSPELKARRKTLDASALDLYEALEELVDICEDVIESGEGLKPYDSFTLQPAKKALAKAEGKDG